MEPPTRSLFLRSRPALVSSISFVVARSHCAAPVGHALSVVSQIKGVTVLGASEKPKVNSKKKIPMSTSEIITFRRTEKPRTHILCD